MYLGESLLQCVSKSLIGNEQLEIPPYALPHSKGMAGLGGNIDQSDLNSLECSTDIEQLKLSFGVQMWGIYDKNTVTTMNFQESWA